MTWELILAALIVVVGVVAWVIGAWHEERRYR